MLFDGIYLPAVFAVHQAERQRNSAATLRGYGTGQCAAVAFNGTGSPADVLHLVQGIRHQIGFQFLFAGSRPKIIGQQLVSRVHIIFLNRREKIIACLGDIAGQPENEAQQRHDRGNDAEYNLHPSFHR